MQRWRFRAPVLEETCTLCFGTGQQIDYKKLGLALAELRKKAGLGQRELGRKVGVSPTHISDIEHGNRKPGFDLLLRMLEAFGYG